MRGMTGRPIEELRRLLAARKAAPDDGGPVRIERGQEVRVETVDEFRDARGLRQCTRCLTWDTETALTTRRGKQSAHKCLFDRSGAIRMPWADGVDAWFPFRPQRADRPLLEEIRGEE